MAAADRILKMKKIVILYHANCPDGFGAAWAAWKKFGARAEYISMKHGDLLPRGLAGKEIYIVDFSLKEPVMNELMKKAKKVAALDHHITAENATKMANEYIYDLNQSGAVIAWKYFHPKKSVPKLLRHIQDVDLWKFKIKNTQEIAAYINSFPFDFKFWSRLALSLKKAKTHREIISEGGAILRHEKDIISRAVKNADLASFAGKKVLVANSSVLKSEIGSALVKKKSPFAIVWSQKEGKTVVSLRAAGKYDVSKLAEKYGGGGHKNASAFVFDLKKKVPWKIIK